MRPVVFTKSKGIFPLSTFLILLLSLVILHVIIDFYFQPIAWGRDKNNKHEKSSKLFYHTVMQSYRP
ncbi:DUF3307 domain-containing protein [Colwellia sp. Arc7-635]|nr:DUF3307 domain-containing protein [Colwellia sp. Arc7-635]